MDILWNKLQLAKVSRKHGLPNLAQNYLNHVKRPLFSTRSGATDSQNNLKVEKFLYMYETLKIQLLVIENSDNKAVNLEFKQNCNQVKAESDQYDKWMNAEFLRL